MSIKPHRQVVRCQVCRGRLAWREVTPPGGPLVPPWTTDALRALIAGNWRWQGRPPAVAFEDEGTRIRWTCHRCGHTVVMDAEQVATIVPSRPGEELSA